MIMYQRGRDPFLRSSRRQRSWRWPGIFLIALAVIIFLGPGLASLFGFSLPLLAKPMGGSSGFVSRLLDAATVLGRGPDQILVENQQLRTEIARLKVKLLDYEIVKADQATLLGQLSTIEDQSQITIGRVISTLWTNPFDVLLAELPAGHPVTVGNPVTFGGVLFLGRVVEVQDRLVKIRLLSASGQATPITIATSTAGAVAMGQGGGNFQIILPRGVPVAVGDVVGATSTPAGWYLGRVGGLEREASESTQTIFVRYPINLHALRFVEVHPY